MRVTAAIDCEHERKEMGRNCDCRYTKTGQLISKCGKCSSVESPCYVATDREKQGDQGSMDADAVAAVTSAQLLPCPFCDSHNVTVEFVGRFLQWQVECHDCVCAGPANDYSKETAASDWNQRARQQPDNDGKDTVLDSPT